MKQVIFATATIFLLLGAIFFNLQYLKSFVATTSETLESAVDFAKNENFQEAQTLFSQVQKSIESHESYLSIILMHEEIDEINLALSGALAYLEAQELPEFLAEAGHLDILIEHLLLLEEFSWRNVL